MASSTAACISSIGVLYLTFLRSVLLVFLGDGIFGVGKSDPDVILLQNIKNRDPVLTGRFHADISTVVFIKPFTQLLQTFGK